MPKHSAEVYYEQAMIFNSKGETRRAIVALQEAINHREDYHEAFNSRGAFLQKLGNNFDAILCHERAITLDPNVAIYHNNVGSAFINMNALERAEKSFMRALELQPIFAEAQMNLGNIYRLQNRQYDAIGRYRKAIEARKNYVDAHLNLTFALLQVGNFEEGWKEYEWRWESDQLPRRGLSVPPWSGERGATVLLYGEQGLGDMIQFMRFAPIVQKEFDCKVYIEVRRPLERIAKTMEGIEGVIALGDKLPKVDYCLPMMSVPKVLKTTVKTVPANIPYVKVDPDSVSMWEGEVRKLPAGLRVGICWAGQSRVANPVAFAVDQRRSTNLSSFARLAAIPGISWVSLQLGPPSAQIAQPPNGMTILDASSDIDDYYDTAALLKTLDLVISVDTSVVHMAGALGVPTWLLSRFDNCWRWMGDRQDSPWYPSIRQFRQPSLGDWDSLIKEVQGELIRLVNEHQAKAA